MTISIESFVLLNQWINACNVYAMLICHSMPQFDACKSIQKPKPSIRYLMKCGKSYTYSYLLRGLWIIKSNNAHVNLYARTYSKCGCVSFKQQPKLRATFG